jgi:hypothetical protein
MMTRRADKRKGIFPGKGTIQGRNCTSGSREGYLIGMRGDVGVPVQMVQGMDFRTPFFYPFHVMGIMDTVDIGKFCRLRDIPGSI